jgi:nitrite reductase (NADH) small subunit
MSDWIKVAELKELKRRRKTVVIVEGREIALFLVGEKVYALQNICIHQERMLSKGTIFNGKVICPGHQWAYDLETGWESTQDRCQPTFAAKVEDAAVHVIAEPRVLVDAPDRP